MIGLTLGNRYVIEENVGIGGMAIVYKAKDTLLNRYVAVKVLKNEFMDDEEFLKKFAMEAQSAASLSHQNIVSVYDVGSSTIDNKKYNYIVMEYIDGKTLKDIINEKGALEPEYIANIGFQIAAAIEAAHKNGVIHRDIKPHNILINSDNIAKVTDFGIARISSSATITYTSTVLGTVHYISPEQAKGKFIDEKSDIYSLGVVLYEMATGKVPFDAENAVGIALKHIQDPLIDPKSINNSIPDGLNEIIIKAMEKNPGDRFENATEIKIALLNYRNYKANYNDDLEKTERIGVIKDEDIEDKKDTKAIYNMPKEEDEEEKHPKKKEKEKGKFFKTYILPIILALLVIVVAVVAVKAFNGELKLFGKDKVKAPNLLDYTYSEAEELLKEEYEEYDLGLEIVESDGEDNSEEGKIINQDPAAGTEIKKGTTIKVSISSGEEEVTVTNLKDLTREAAIAEINRLGLKRGAVQDQYSDTVPNGIVISQEPEEGAVVAPGSTVTIVVSKGVKPKNPKMQDVTGFTVDRATSILNELGLVVSYNKEYSDNVEVDRVIKQSISPDTEVQQGQKVVLTVSLGPEETPTEAEENNSTTNATFSINTSDIMEGAFDVRITSKDGNTIYKKRHNTNEGKNIDIDISNVPVGKYDIFIAGEYYNTVTVQ
ncbi:Stk1 family PASTA domain-containing Ser/Thr kinase [Miniphocaeibacter halophilus]|uniref:Stk1 family PASTA domain-containing Ser/Thr kinase n=1 Tax=Miniphocaeibacter halophilus TaxID=2931922 RepID=A0AC61MTQ7_9FIRM|nr:Stk1 family PASTA domain-containing Ser/Thr kinase [Miniphocaeibacter halophilus]QQK07756.1 Stk1 family PASTA domain-containing Ser/Thr kinase [Miniphocaeibacter halophilus]